MPDKPTVRDILAEIADLLSYHLRDKPGQVNRLCEMIYTLDHKPPVAPDTSDPPVVWVAGISGLNSMPSVIMWFRHRRRAVVWLLDLIWEHQQAAKTQIDHEMYYCWGLSLNMRHAGDWQSPLTHGVNNEGFFLYCAQRKPDHVEFFEDVTA